MISWSLALILAAFAQVDPSLLDCRTPEVGMTWSAVRIADVDSSVVYVEPTTFAASPGGAVVLAGAPGRIFSIRAHDESLRVDSILGLILSPDGTAGQVVSLPGFLRDSIGTVRLAPYSSDAWLAVGPGAGAGQDEIWAGTWTAGRWTDATRLPSISPADALLDFGSDPVATPGGVAFAVPVRFPAGSEVPSLFGIGLFRMLNGRWWVELLPLEYSAGASLAYDSTEGLVLAVGVVLQGRGVVLIYSERTGWGSPIRVLPSPVRPMGTRWSSPWRARGLAWEGMTLGPAPPRSLGIAVRDALAAVGTARAEPVMLGGDVYQVVPVGEWRGREVWAVARALPPDGQRRLELMVWDGAEPRVVYEGPDIFDGPIRGIWSGPDQLWTTGGARSAVRGRQLIESRLQVFTFGCPAPGPGE